MEILYSYNGIQSWWVVLILLLILGAILLIVTLCFNLIDDNKVAAIISGMGLLIIMAILIFLFLTPHTVKYIQCYFPNGFSELDLTKYIFCEQKGEIYTFKIIDFH